jgi:hypothetical protein
MPGAVDACQDAARAQALSLNSSPAGASLIPGGASSDVTVIEIPETNAGRLQTLTG